MFNETHYVPILKGKQGEFGALESLSSETKACMTPLVEIAPIPPSSGQGRAPRTVERHLGNFLSGMADGWNGGSPAFVDFRWLPPDVRVDGTVHPVSYVFQRAYDQGLHLVPTLALGRDSAHNDVVSRVVAEYDCGVCLRLAVEDFAGGNNAFVEASRLLRRLSVERGSADLMLDFSWLPPNSAASTEITAIHLLQAAHADDWRTVTIAGTGFPHTLSSCRPDAVSLIRRVEWSVWLSVVGRIPRGGRIPTFGDYCIAHPELVDFDPVRMKVSANVRYTADENWIILKGRSVNSHGFEQCRSLCDILVGRADYRGANFSWGDWFIYECAAGREGPGNATTWRKVGTSHHLTLLPNQIASVFAS